MKPSLNREKDLAGLKMFKCEKGCDKYNRSVDEIVGLLQNTGKIKLVMNRKRR